MKAENPRKSILLRLPKNRYDQCAKIADDYGMSISAFVRACISITVGDIDKVDNVVERMMMGNKAKRKKK